MKITLFQFVLVFVFLNVAMANKMKSSPRVLVDKEAMVAQTIVIIKGRVIDEKGESLAGATVLVRNTAQQITTDSNGNYTLSAKIGYVLQFSHVGLKTKNIKVNSRTLKVKPKGDILNVVLDVVLVGIG
jgi:hypothetical protein